MDKVDFSNIASQYEDYSVVQKSAGDILLNLLRIGDNDDVLDLGCGADSLTKKIRETTNGTVVGIDSSDEMVRKAVKKNKGLNIYFEIKSAEDMDYKDCFDVIFCNSVMQWFRELEKAVKNCYTALRKGGRIGIQSPAKEVYSPNFINAIENIKGDLRTRDIFSHFKSPWFFLETAAEYKDLIEKGGFNVIFSKIDSVKARHTPEDVFKIFSSGAIAGYLNQDFYNVKIDNAYIGTFTDIIKIAFIQQADNNGEVELIFHRLFLVAIKE